MNAAGQYFTFYDYFAQFKVKYSSSFTTSTVMCVFHFWSAEANFAKAHQTIVSGNTSISVDDEYVP